MNSGDNDEDVTPEGAARPWTLPEALRSYLEPTTPVPPAAAEQTPRAGEQRAEVVAEQPAHVHVPVHEPELVTVGAPMPPGPPPSAPEAEAFDEGTPERAKEKSFLRELPVLLAIAIVLALVLKAFVVQAFFIPSGSMENTLLVKDRVLVNKIGYRLHDIKRGDIVVFNGKNTSFPQETLIRPATNPIQSGARKVQRFFGLGAPGERDYIKRVIAVGGDTVQCCVNGHVEVNGKELNETYLFEDNQLAFCQDRSKTATLRQPANGPECQTKGAAAFVVPKGNLFVMGDHRRISSDSRYNGVIPESAVIGRAFVLVWPFSRLDRFGTPPTFS